MPLCLLTFCVVRAAPALATRLPLLLFVPILLCYLFFGLVERTSGMVSVPGNLVAIAGVLSVLAAAAFGRAQWVLDQFDPGRAPTVSLLDIAVMPCDIAASLGLALGIWIRWDGSSGFADLLDILRR